MYVNAEGERNLVGVTSFVASASAGGCHSGMPAGNDSNFPREVLLRIIILFLLSTLSSLS